MSACPTLPGRGGARFGNTTPKLYVPSFGNPVTVIAEGRFLNFVQRNPLVLWIAMDILSDLTVVGVDLLKESNHGIHQIARMILYVALKF